MLFFLPAQADGGVYRPNLFVTLNKNCLCALSIDLGRTWLAIDEFPSVALLKCVRLPILVALLVVRTAHVALALTERGRKRTREIAFAATRSGRRCWRCTHAGANLRT